MSPRPFRFAVQVNHTESASQWRDLARRVEGLGYSTMHVSDHYLDRDLPPPAVMYVAPIAAMATAAAVTSTLRVGCRVFCVDYHVPATFAKESATLDLLSEGRLELGIGAGWSAGEYAAMGVPMGSAADRVTKLEEVVALLKAHWSGEVIDIDGAHVHVSGYAGLPLPVQKPHPPLMIGGAKKRVLSLAAREAQIVSFSNVPAVEVNDAGLTPDGEARRRLGYVVDAAGDRFASLDLESSPYHSIVTSDLAGASEMVAQRLRCSPELAVDHPNVLVGSIDRIVDVLLERRENYGVNYVTVQQDVFEAFAPVVERLSGS